ncbi:MAG: hypothetical protein ACREYE_25850 [Gammaproteobacteria bacterium]
MYSLVAHVSRLALQLAHPGTRSCHLLELFFRHSGASRNDDKIV